MHQFDLLRQHGLDAEFENGVRVPAANFHQRQRPAPAHFDPSNELADLAQKGPRFFRVAELIDIFHRGSFLRSVPICHREAALAAVAIQGNIGDLALDCIALLVIVPATLSLKML